MFIIKNKKYYSKLKSKLFSPNLTDLPIKRS
jgi:hypothetical protein